MTVTAKDLRLKTSEILKRVQRGGSITVTLRGKPVARLISILGEKSERELEDYAAIGMWADRKDMKDPSAWVRKIRQPRYSLR
jgi:prevent-host-death family protein